MSVIETMVRGEKRWIFRITQNGKARNRYFRTKALANAELKKEEARYSRMGNRAQNLREERLMDASLAFESLDKAQVSVSMQDVVAFYLRHAVIKNISVEEAIDKFVEAAENKELSRGRIRNIKRYLSVLPRGIFVKNVEYEQLEDGLGRIPTGSKHQTYKCFKQFFAWCKRRDYLEKDPSIKLEVAKPKDFTRTILTPEEMEFIWRFGEDTRLSVLLMLGAGCRTSETFHFNKEWIGRNDSILLIPKDVTKTNSDRRVSLDPVVYELIKKYADQEINRPKVDSIYKAFAEHFGKTWPRNACRHTFATYSAAKFGLAHAAESLGHSGLSLIRTHYANLSAQVLYSDFLNIFQL